jgi:hypothetical protein
MPVRSSRTAVLRWPDRDAVDSAVRAWGRRVLGEGRGVEAVGYYGSYARGDWGVGSDVDLVVVVRDSGAPFERRAAAWDATALPVPADLVVYTEAEWGTLPSRPWPVEWVAGRPPEA